VKAPSCYNCASGEHTPYAEENGFELVKCAECGLLFVRNPPDPDQISEAHKQGTHQGEYELEVTGEFRPRLIPRYTRVLDDLFEGDLGHIRSWLEVGCGHGEFLLSLRKYSGGSIRLTGTEPNLRKQASARERNLDVGYFEIDSHPGRYDAISLLNVYSHLPDPPTFLRSLRALLNPGGELLVQTGDTAELSANDHYRPFSLPDHLSFASERIVTGILKRLGFEIVVVKKYPFVPFSVAGVAKEVAKVFVPGYQSRLRYYLKWSMYAETDMFIRARLPR
jgi:SAM-dependent methyltransferase